MATVSVQQKHTLSGDAGNWWAKTVRRLKGMNRFLYVAFGVCMLLLVLTDLIPSALGSFSLTWIKFSLDAIFSSILGAIAVMMLFDYYDINGELSYMKGVVTKLLDLHESEDYTNRIIDTMLVREGAIKDLDPDQFNELMTSLIKEKYHLADTPDDKAHLDQVVQDIDRQFKDRLDNAEK
jgi:uncharacterized protein YacL